MMMDSMKAVWCVIVGHRWHCPMEWMIDTGPAGVTSWTCSRCHRFTVIRTGETPERRRGSIRS